MIGLTGQTGAGKTTVSHLLEDAGFAIVNADLVARSIVEAGKPCLQALAGALGNAILNADGTMNRRLVASIVFQNPEKKRQMEEIMYPYITAEIETQISGFAKAGFQSVILDAPTLFESGINKRCHRIVSVIAESECRRNRIMERDGLTITQAQQRMDAQHSEAFFRANSQDIIENNGDETVLKEAVRALVETLNHAAKQYDKENYT